LSTSLAKLVNQQFKLIKVDQLNDQSRGIEGVGNGLSKELFYLGDVESVQAIN